MVEVKIKRDEALEAVAELVKRISVIYDEGQEAMEEEYKALGEQLQQAVTEQMVIVLPKEGKS
ncbi:uncharacterized protein TrAtP1_007093 [Trichoderma atroviride]|nr:hypothetical protein TrAtP1_007093 [Trichoderma atroviride]